MQLTMIVTLFSTNLQCETMSALPVRMDRGNKVVERVSYAQRFTMAEYHVASGVSRSLTRYTSDKTLATMPLSHVDQPPRNLRYMLLDLHKSRSEDTQDLHSSP
jgi:hypothetical protein